MVFLLQASRLCCAGKAGDRTRISIVAAVVRDQINSRRSQKSDLILIHVSLVRPAQIPHAKPPRAAVPAAYKARLLLLTAWPLASHQLRNSSGLTATF